MSSSRIFNGKRVDERNEFITLREGELSVDLCNLSIYVHDGHTPGGRQVGTGAAGQNGVSITGALVNDAGHLILTKSDLTTIDAGSVVGPAGTGTNFQSTGTGTVVVGFGLQLNPDGTISVNSATIQSLLPILEINPHGQATTQITNNLWVQGLISASSLTVTNAIIFGDGTIMTSTNSINVQTIAVSNITGSTVTNETNEVGAIRFDTAGFTVTDIGGGEVKITAISGGAGSTGTIWTNSANGCLRAELSSTGFQAFTDASHLDLQDSGEWNIGSYQNSTFIGNDAFSNTNILSLKSGDETYITTNLRENGNHQWKFGADGILTFPDGSKQVTAGGLIQSSTAPATTSTSTIWYDTVGGRSYVYYDSGWVDASPVSTYTFTGTSTLVNGTYTVALSTTGQLNLPSAANTENNHARIQSANSIDILSNLALWAFGTDGSLTLPAPAPITFTATLVPVYHAGGGGNAWYYTVIFQPLANGDGYETMISGGNTAWDHNPGYQSGDSWTFTQADHGIPGYTFTFILDDISNGPAGWTANFATGPGPEYPSTVKSTATIKLSADTKNWTFGTDGVLTMPDGNLGGNGAINFNWEGNNWASISSSESTLNLYSLSVVNGNPKTNVRIGDNVELTTNLLDSAYTWTFGTDGTLTFPSGTSIGSLEGSAGIFGPNGTDFLINTRFDNTGFYQAWTFGTDGKLTFPNNSKFDGQTLTDHSSSTNYTLKIANGGVAGSVFGIGTGDATFGIANDALNHAENGYVPYTVTAQNINLTVPGSGTWRFGTDGSLAFPNTQLGMNSQIYTTSSGYQTVFETFLTDNGRGSGQKLTLDYEYQQVQIQTVAGVEWKFGQFGDLTFPDATVQTTAFTASSYISKATLQSIISTCTSFTEFKNAILGL